MYRDTEGGHCQGACHPQWFFYVPLNISETALPFMWLCEPWEIHSLQRWRARSRSPQASPMHERDWTQGRHVTDEHTTTCAIAPFCPSGLLWHATVISLLHFIAQNKAQQLLNWGKYQSLQESFLFSVGWQMTLVWPCNCVPKCDAVLLQRTNYTHTSCIIVIIMHIPTCSSDEMNHLCSRSASFTTCPEVSYSHTRSRAIEERNLLVLFGEVGGVIYCLTWLAGLSPLSCALLF